jgi:hypothetical protein
MRKAGFAVFLASVLILVTVSTGHPQSLLNRLRSEYGGATYRVLQCSHVPQDRCFQETDSFPCGCNEMQYGGSYWYDGHFTVHVAFPSDGTIVFLMSWAGQDRPLLRGIPKGPNIEDISWEASMGSTNPQWEPAWVNLSNGLSNITYSPPGGQLKRPVNSSQYGSYSLYNYNQFIKN